MGGSFETFYKIPGNIKQQIIPFVLDPNNTLHSNVTNSSELGKNKSVPQKFSFRSIDKKGGVISIVPKSISDYIKNDVSFKMLYKRDPEGFFISEEDIDITALFNNFPAVQIREFIPDSQFDQYMEQFSTQMDNLGVDLSLSSTAEVGESGIQRIQTFLETTTTAIEEGYKSNGIIGAMEGGWKKISKIAQRFADTAYFIMRYMTSSAKTKDGKYYGFTDDFTNAAQSLIDFQNLSYSFTDPIKNTPFGKVLMFPYMMYYKMQSCTTNNIYEIPYTYNNKAVLDSSSGMAGWTDGDPGGFRLKNLASKLLGALPIVGQVGKFLGSIIDPYLGNIGFNYTPWWNPDGVFNTREPEIEITFDLFNDSYKSSMINFIFVNTLIPNNKWIQYGMFQHSSSLYDVKIEGVNRLFACTGAFHVDGLGVLRTPTDQWVYDLVCDHMSPQYETSDFLTNILKDNLIRIPDVYHVTMKFQSLLPANFNNYIYNYVKNQNITTEYAEKVFEENQMSKAVKDAMKNAKDAISKAWNAANGLTDDTYQARAKKIDEAAKPN